MWFGIAQNKKYTNLTVNDDWRPCGLQRRLKKCKKQRTCFQTKHFAISFFDQQQSEHSIDRVKRP